MRPARCRAAAFGLGASVRTVARETVQGDEGVLFGYDESGWREGKVCSWVASSTDDSAGR